MGVALAAGLTAGGVATTVAASRSSQGTANPSTAGQGTTRQGLAGPGTDQSQDQSQDRTPDQLVGPGGGAPDGGSHGS